MGEAIFINKDKKANYLEVGDTFNVFWTTFNTGTFEDENLNQTIEGEELTTL